jgi:hypothetical protein
MMPTGEVHSEMDPLTSKFRDLSLLSDDLDSVPVGDVGSVDTVEFQRELRFLKPSNLFLFSSLP